MQYRSEFQSETDQNERITICYRCREYQNEGIGDYCFGCSSRVARATTSSKKRDSLQDTSYSIIFERQ